MFTGGLLFDIISTMIIDNIQNRAFYRKLESRVGEALEYLAALDRAQQPVEDTSQTAELVGVTLDESIAHVVGLRDGLDLVGDLLERA